MATVPIEKNVPVPADARRTFGEMKYPWADMDVGDSFEFTLGIRRSSCASSAAKMSKKLGRKFVARQDKASGIVRCWRIE